MAIRDKFEEEEKNGMKVVTNMNGEKNAEKKLNMKVADISDKMNTAQIQEYLRRAKEGGDVVGYLRQFNLQKIELDQLKSLMDKRS